MLAVISGGGKTCGERKEVNIPFGSASDGNVFVIRP
jgi:hypothetical protein